MNKIFYRDIKGRFNHELRGSNKILLNCDNCGKELNVYPYKIKTQKNHFCSKKCQSQWLSKQPDYMQPNYKGIKIKCKECGIVIRTDKSKKIFCSKKCYSSFQSKQSPYNKGKKTGSWGNHSLESRLKISLAHRKKNHNYNKIGTPEERNNLRCLIEYKEWRKKVFERDNYTCQECGKRGGKLNADHIKPFAYYPELRLNIDNGRTLCVKCHKNTKTYGAAIHKLFQKEFGIFDPLNKAI